MAVSSLLVAAQWPLLESSRWSIHPMSTPTIMMIATKMKTTVLAAAVVVHGRARTADW
jgi:hypothetical protein